MSKKVLVISTSLRNNSNTDILADEFVKGAIDCGHDVEKISLRGKKINFCSGCEICQDTGKCVIQDDANEIIQKMHDTEVLVFAAPVYFGGVSGQVQTLMDRTYQLMSLKHDRKQNHKFGYVYLLTASAEADSTEYTDFVVDDIKNWIKSFDGTYRECEVKANFAGVVHGLGVWDAGEIRKYPDKLKETYEMGKAI